MEFNNTNEAYTALIEQARDGQFPLNAFPGSFRTAVSNMTRRGEFRTEYVAMAMLSALAATIGNTISLEIRDGFRVNPALMITFVGKPGAGKTPPLMAAYEALRRSDHRRYQQWRQAMHDYNAKQSSPSPSDGGTGSKRPVCQQTVLSDFTQEAMVSQLESNPTGVAIVVDEIAGFFNTVNRYNASNMIETLLSAFSGDPIKVTRKGPDGQGQIVSVMNPSINLIGTIQPSLLHSVLFRPLEGNGFLDRMCFVYPQCNSTSRWSDHPGYADGHDKVKPQSPLNPAFERWSSSTRHADAATILWEKIHSTAENLTKGDPLCLRLSPDAQRWFYNWRDDLMEGVDDTDENEAESRVMKRVAIISKIALLLQVGKVAAGEQQIHVSISLEAIMGAVAINEWLEWSYRRARRAALESTGRPSGPSQRQMESWAFVAQLPDTFTYNDALQAAQKIGKRKTWVKDKLHEMVEASALAKVERGKYCKATLLK